MHIANLASRLVIVKGDRAIDVASASGGLFSSSPQDIYERWDEFCDWSRTAALDRGASFAAADLQAPAPSPRQVFAIGLNYNEHAAEANENAPEFPPVFTKFPTSLTGPYSSVRLPTSTVDWEVELVVIIGRRAYRIPEERAWDYVAGVTVGQDLSERTSQLRPPIPQFSLGKSFPGFSPTGPYLVTPDELDDKDDLRLECSVGDETLQSGRTSQMIFSVACLIEKLSSVCPLLPGDIIFTGTPSGVGVARNPQRFLRAGEVLVTTIEGVGTLRNELIEAEG